MPTLTARSTTLTDLPSARPASSSNSLTAFPSSDFTPGSAGGGDGNHPHAIDFTGRELDHVLADVQKRRAQFLQVGLLRLVLEFHEFRRIDHASAAERDNLVRFMEIERFHSLHDDLELGFRVGNGENADVSLRWNRAPDQVHVAHLFQKRIADDEGKQ